MPAFGVRCVAKVWIFYLGYRADGKEKSRKISGTESIQRL